MLYVCAVPSISCQLIELSFSCVRGCLAATACGVAMAAAATAQPVSTSSRVQLLHSAARRCRERSILGTREAKSQVGPGTLSFICVLQTLSLVTRTVR